ncbi:MAG TPA: TIGR03620 family F420-dependent LLM class oxidoreductase [Novosphingobium sp.]|nr:TIGR03620 family F420-dependent LLM class oxidoreductase [Novosphingobium sp.]
MSKRPNLGQIGIWSMELRFGDASAIAEAAAELDELGFPAILVPGGVGGDVAGDINRLLAATSRATIATGIINIWKHTPAEIAGWWDSLPDDQRERLLLGLGISHAPLIGEGWNRPVARTREWVEDLLGLGVPAQNLCLAALGPKMVALSGELTAGAHPYLVTPEHSRIARDSLCPDPLLGPEQAVVLETGPARARELARGALVHYARLPNYRNNWLRLGFTEADCEGQSDALLDGLFAWGTLDSIRERVQQHQAAGADHVCLQAITGGGLPEARAAWRELAKLL